VIQNLNWQRQLTDLFLAATKSNRSC